jgi:membrane dipeptidase (peptidase family M19)
MTVATGAVSKLHQDALIVDGLIIANFTREVFEDMRRGGLAAANCTCCVWENFRDTMENVARWKRLLRDNADLITQVYTTEDIRRAKREGKTGIILGWQNVSGIEDQIPFLALFKELGVGIIQMAYNTQNLVGTGCYEKHDGGLSEFGHEVVAEMNRVGILCDLSHVGAKTSEDVIRASKKPVAYSHCLPAGLKQHPRNKSDEQIRFIAERGGFECSSCSEREGGEKCAQHVASGCDPWQRTVGKNGTPEAAEYYYKSGCYIAFFNPVVKLRERQNPTNARTWRRRCDVRHRISSRKILSLFP